jgi:hypothetical protein
MNTFSEQQLARFRRKCRESWRRRSIKKNTKMPPKDPEAVIPYGMNSYVYGSFHNGQKIGGLPVSEVTRRRNEALEKRQLKELHALQLLEEELAARVAKEKAEATEMKMKEEVLERPRKFFIDE